MDLNGLLKGIEAGKRYILKEDFTLIILWGEQDT